MIWVDYCILGIVVMSVLVGVLRGFARELLGTLTWLVAAAASWVFGASAAQRLADQIANPAIRSVAGYALVFFGALFIGAVVTHLVSLVIRSVGAGGIDRTLGAGFGLLRGVFVVVFVVMLAGTSASQSERWWRDSRLIPPLVPLADGLRTMLPAHWISIIKSPDFVPAADLSRLSTPSSASEAAASLRDPSLQTVARPAEGS